MKTVTEKSFMQTVIQMARLYRWRVYHTHDSRRSAAGFPDLVLVRGTRLIFVELKTDIGKVSPDQQQWMSDLRAAGQPVYLWRPKDWVLIEAVLGVQS